MTWSKGRRQMAERGAVRNQVPEGPTSLLVIAAPEHQLEECPSMMCIAVQPRGFLAATLRSETNEPPVAKNAETEEHARVNDLPLRRPSKLDETDPVFQPAERFPAPFDLNVPKRDTAADVQRSKDCARLVRSPYLDRCTSRVGGRAERLESLVRREEEDGVEDVEDCARAEVYRRSGASICNDESERGRERRGTSLQ